MRSYLRQWIDASASQGEGIERFRKQVDAFTSRAAIEAWINDAIEEGGDPM